MKARWRESVGQVHTGAVPDSEGKTLADVASTWMQVVFGALGVGIAIVGLVIAYFAWIQPHSPDGGNQAGPPVSATTTGTAPASPANRISGKIQVALAELAPSFGGANIHRSGGDLTLPCASGESNDLLRTVEYDLLGRYSTIDGELRVSKARDADTALQIKVFADGQEAAKYILTKGKSIRLKVPIVGRQQMRVELTCQFPDGEITLGNPTLTRS
jgi:hypothetical protein